VGGHVLGQFFEEPCRPAHRDGHRDFERPLRIVGVQDRQGHGDLADGVGHRGLEPLGLAGESGNDRRCGR
jgi:hypothetical protein